MNNTDGTSEVSTTASFLVKAGLAKMLKGGSPILQSYTMQLTLLNFLNFIHFKGVIMDVVNVEQAKIAEAAGAVAVMALERIPADIRRDGGVARMSDPDMIREIKAAVTIPVMAKVSFPLPLFQEIYSPILLF